MDLTNITKNIDSKIRSEITELCNSFLLSNDVTAEADNMRIAVLNDIHPLTGLSIP